MKVKHGQLAIRVIFVVIIGFISCSKQGDGRFDQNSNIKKIDNQSIFFPLFEQESSTKKGGTLYDPSYTAHNLSIPSFNVITSPSGSVRTGSSY